MRVTNRLVDLRDGSREWIHGPGMVSPRRCCGGLLHAPGNEGAVSSSRGEDLGVWGEGDGEGGRGVPLQLAQLARALGVVEADRAVGEGDGEDTGGGVARRTGGGEGDAVSGA